MKQKNQIEKKSVLYKKKCDKYITEEEFKEEYAKIKEQQLQYNKRIEELEKNSSSINKKGIRKIITEFRSGKEVNNEFLKEIIYRIEVYSNNRINIIFKL